MLQPLNDSLRFLQSNWFRLGFLCLPIALIHSVASYMVTGDVSLSQDMTDEQILEVVQSLLAPMGMLYLVFTPLLNSLALSYIRNGVNFANFGYSSAVAGALKVLPHMGLLVALITIVSVGGLYLFIVPGLLLYFRLSLAPVIIVDQEASVSTALKMSWRVTGTYWRTLLLGYVLITVALTFIASFLGSFVPNGSGLLITCALTTFNTLLALSYEVYKYRIFQLSLEQ